MAPGRSRDPRKERQWRRWIARWQTSGLSISAFCARHGLPLGNFYAWRSTLQRRDAQQIPFVPVQVVANPAPPPGGTLELLLSDGHLLRIPPGFDAASLRAVLAVLREDPPC